MLDALISLVTVITTAVTATAPAVTEAPLTLREYTVAPETLQEISDEWIEDLLATHPENTWAPIEFRPTDDQLARLSLPPTDVLLSRRYPEPTMISPDGTAEVVDLAPISQETGTMGPTVATYAGAGWTGIRPGAWVLLLNDGYVSWCSLAHVYGSPGSYQISTAGHCGGTGDIATVIAAFGDRNGVLNPVLLDFGKFKTSHDGGLGNDWALIDIFPQYQKLVSPTMAFWGGPRGMYTKVGQLAGISFPRRGLVPSVSLTPDPTLAQGVVHYGHGLGVGAGGTPRAGTAIYWGNDHYMFEGLIAPGDSGSGANTLTGDTLGANMEAAGIMTHLWIDPLMRSGIGIMGGTRATEVSGTLANGQLVSYPVPVTGLP
ncbi:MAG: S1 family peptidase [Actinomycetota bacterium]|nr:S1 family peptidase [Actinomycetota bacterium]